MKKGKTKSDAEVKDLDKMESLNFQCVNGNDKFMLYPILEWSETDVWQFIARQKLPYNIVYDDSSRVGCLLCPFASTEEILFNANKYPKHWALLKKSFCKYLENKKDKALETVDEYLDWWLSKGSIEEYKAQKAQLELFTENETK